MKTMLTPVLVAVWALVGSTAVAAEAASPKGEVLKSGDFELVLPLGLQADAAYVPDGNPITAEKVALGKLLFFDKRLSSDDTVSCASCHNPYHGYGDANEKGVGVGSKVGGRNSQTALNRLFSAEQFWDGRAQDLEDQAHGPLTNPLEMAMPSHDAVVAKVKSIKGYGPLFQKAYGDGEITMPRIAQAIATYERTVLAGNSPYDRYKAGDKSAMSAEQIEGLALFEGKANCATCHASFNFSDENYHNLGVGWDAGAGKLADEGRFAVSKRDADKGAFKTPTLRNVAERAPYMHDGSEPTLRDVMVLYNRGGNANPHLDAKMKPLGLTDGEIDAVVAFMYSLSGPVTNATPPASFPQ